jgi:DNA-binding CsgD family transcriptional regulator
MTGSVTTSSILRLVDDIYAAALDENRWKDVLRETCKLVGSEVGSFDWRNPRSGHAAVHCSVGVSPEWEQRYEAHFGKLNPFQQRLPFSVRSGDVLDGNVLITWDELRKGEYFNDFLAPMGCSTGAGICLSLTNEFASFLSILRPLHDREFSDCELSILETLAPHFQRALTIHQHLRRVAAERHNSLDALECLPWGLILLERTARAWFVNREARRVVSEDDGLVMQNERLRSTGERRRDLEATIVAACEKGRSDLTRSEVILKIVRRSGKRPYHITVIPQAHASLDVLGLPTVASGALVLISDPERTPQPAIDSLRQLYGLTRAEAALAGAMSRGLALADHANNAGITTGTARKLLKQLFAKTNTHRQGELVSLLLRSSVLPEPNKHV